MATYVLFHGKSVFAGVINLRILDERISWIRLVAQCNHKSLSEWEASGSKSEGRNVKTEVGILVREREMVEDITLLA